MGGERVLAVEHDRLPAPSPQDLLVSDAYNGGAAAGGAGARERLARASPDLAPPALLGPGMGRPETHRPMRRGPSLSPGGGDRPPDIGAALLPPLRGLRSGDLRAVLVAAEDGVVVPAESLRRKRTSGGREP